MKVCNVCLGPPDYSGQPMMQKGAGDKVYLFAPDWQASSVDLCSTCVENFQHGRWDKIAESAHDVLMLRLGVPRESS